MTSLRGRLVAGIAVAALVLIGAAAYLGATTAPPGQIAPEATPPTSPVTGVVVNVDSEGLNRVRSFDLRTDDGAVWTFVIGRQDNAVEFPPSHLLVHLADSYPCEVSFRLEDGRLVAYHLSDPRLATPTLPLE